jgi:hypothetical protein
MQMNYSLDDLKNFPDKYKNYYMQVIPICKECDLFSEADETCIVNEDNIFNIIKSDLPICPIGNW